MQQEGGIGTYDWQVLVLQRGRLVCQRGFRTSRLSRQCLVRKTTRFYRRTNEHSRHKQDANTEANSRHKSGTSVTLPSPPLSVCVCVCRSICLFVSRSLCLSLGRSVSPFVCLSVCRSVCLFVCLSACLSLSVCVWVCLAVAVCMCVSVCAYWCVGRWVQAWVRSSHNSLYTGTLPSILISYHV